jgi:ribosome-binding protein aMBF1 (putative translation factor)
VTPTRLIACRRILHWSRLALAEETGRDEKQIRRWEDGATIPDEIAAWIERRVKLHQRHPAPVGARKGEGSV